MNLSYVLLLSLLLESSYANNVRRSKGIPRRSRRLAEDGEEPKEKSSKKSHKSPSEKEAEKAAKEAEKAAKEAEKAANEDTPVEPTGYQVPMTEVLDQDSKLTAPPQTDGIALTAPPQMQNEQVQGVVQGTASPTDAVQTSNQFQQANKPADVQDPILVTDSKYSPSVGGNIADLTVQCVGDCTTDCAMFSANNNYFDGVLDMDYKCVTKCMDGKNDICANLKLCQNKC